MVLKVLDRNGQRELADLVEVQRHDPDHLAVHIEHRAAAQAGIHGCADQSPVERVFPVGIERRDRGQASAADPPPVFFARAGGDEHVVAGLQFLGRTQGRGREAAAGNLDQPDAAGKILGHHLAVDLAVVDEADLDLTGPNDDVVDRQDVARWIDNSTRAHPFRAKEWGRVVILGDCDMDAHSRGDNLFNELYGGVHSSSPIQKIRQA